MFFEESLIFVPSPYPSGNWQPPGLPIEDAYFTTADGVKLHGWCLAQPSPTAVVLFCHGNAGNVTHRAEILRILAQSLNCTTLVFDYRGYGRSEGRPNESGVLQDARAARAWLARRAGVAEGDVVLMGESLGGGVAVDLAAADGARALVLQSTFSSLPDAAAYHFPWLPVRWLMRTRLDSLAKIGKYHGPLLQCHGDCDSIVPHDLGRRLFDAANEPKQWIELPGHDHNDDLPPKYFAALREFLDGLPK